MKSVEVGENEFAPEDVTDWEFSISLGELQTALAGAGST